MNHYSKAIEILGRLNFSENREQDITSLLFKIASTRPSAIVRAYGPDKLSPEEKRMHDLRKRCRDLYLAGQKVPAIKLWRSETRASLVDAKDAIEAMARNPL